MDLVFVWCCCKFVLTDAVVFGKLIKHEYQLTKEGGRKNAFNLNYQCSQLKWNLKYKNAKYCEWFGYYSKYLIRYIVMKSNY